MQAATAVGEPEASPGGVDTEHAAAARRFASACALGAVAALVVFAWLAMLGRSNLFARPPFFANFYDIQARSLFRGHWNVPTGSLAFEGIVIHGRTYEYYGPFPALLRMPVLAVTHRFDGRLTEVSMILAFAVAMLGASRLLWRARAMLRGDAPVGRAELALTGAWTFALGVGSALLFPASRMIVYHEAELWGTALALVGFDLVIGVAVSPTATRLALASVVCACALLARPSVGLGPTAMLGILAAGAVLSPLVRRDARGASDRIVGGIRRGWPIAVATAVPVVVYALVNHAKFGTWFSVLFDKQLYSRYQPARIAALHANGGSLFNVRYAATTVWAYARPDALRLWHLFPFADFPTRSVQTFFGVRFDTIDRTSSVPATMALLLVFAVVAVVAVTRGRVRPDVALTFGAATLAAAIAVVPTLVIGFIANRYLIDFVPLVLLPAVVGMQYALRHVDRSWSRRPRRHAAAFLAVTLLALFTVWANGAITLTYQRVYGSITPTLRTGFFGFQESVANTLGTRGWAARHVDTLPRDHSPDALVVVGRCAGLYWWEPRAGWRQLELGAAGGHVRAAVVLAAGARPTSRATIATVGAAAPLQLTVRRVDGSHARVGIVDTSGHAIEGDPVVAPTGRPVVVDALLDRSLGVVSATLDGRTALRAAAHVPVGTPRVVTTGAAGAVSSARALPVATPLCDRIGGSVAAAVRQQGRAGSSS